MIYLNHAATSFPKFPEVVSAIASALENGQTFGNRDSVEAIEAARVINDLRDKLSEIFGANEPHNICFTPSDTIALNHIIASFGVGTILTSSMEHNSVSRPIYKLIRDYTHVKILTVDSASEIEDAIAGHHVSGAIFSHASNVTGDVFDAKLAGEILHYHNIPFALDVAQTAGHIPIKVDEWHVDALAFAGHKGLGGPQGTGGLYVRKGFQLQPVLVGGTGNHSMQADPPITLPDSVEVGTQPAHDLHGLYAALKKIDEIGWEKYAAKPLALAQRVYDWLSSRVRVFGNPQKQIPVVSFVVDGRPCKEVGAFLAEKGIVCRTGVHCSAWGIKKLGLTDGTIRVSFGYSNTDEEVEAFFSAMEEYLKGVK